MGRTRSVTEMKIPTVQFQSKSNQGTDGRHYQKVQKNVKSRHDVCQCLCAVRAQTDSSLRCEGQELCWRSLALDGKTDEEKL